MDDSHGDDEKDAGQLQLQGQGPSIIPTRGLLLQLAEIFFDYNVDQGANGMCINILHEGMWLDWSISHVCTATRPIFMDEMIA